MEISKMVVGYDGSASSRKAVEWAVSLAAKLKSDVVVVAVVRSPEFSPSMDEVEESYTDGERYYQPLLDEMVEYGKENDVPIRTEILRGHPAESLVRYAYDRKADLLVIGNRGAGGFISLIIGSIAQKVVSYSQVPVVVIK
jgi:nucleotide-binding universal stress UspA family protein